MTLYWRTSTFVCSAARFAGTSILLLNPMTTAPEAAASVTSDSLMSPTASWMTMSATSVCGIFARAPLIASSDPWTSALVHVGLDDAADGRAVGVGLEVRDIRHEQHDIDEVLETLLRLRRDRRERRLPAVLLDRDAVLRELALHQVRVGVGLVDLVQRDDDRNARRLHVRDGLDRLWLHAVVRRDHEDGDVGDLRAT